MESPCLCRFTSQAAGKLLLLKKSRAASKLGRPIESVFSNMLLALTETVMAN
jgi:hypothetical protein